MHTAYYIKIIYIQCHVHCLKENVYVLGSMTIVNQSQITHAGPPFDILWAQSNNQEEKFF